MEITAKAAKAASDTVDGQAEMLRSTVTADIAAGELDMEAGTERLEAVRWVRRVCVHIHRMLWHAQHIQGTSD